MTPLEQVVAHLQQSPRVFVSSHQRADGDSIGSSLALALALRSCGTDAVVVMDAPPPHYLQPFPDVDNILLATKVNDVRDAAVLMECSALSRTGVTGLDRSPVINIDHHVGNSGYGAINWIDEGAASCSELAYLLIAALGVQLTPAIATHIYLGLHTDTGGFRFSHITPRSFAIAQHCVEAGAKPQWIASTHYDNSTLARVRVFGHVLNRMELAGGERVALLTLSGADAMALEATADDAEGIINFPLSVRQIQAVAFFKQSAPHEWRVSMRSKGTTDVGTIARAHGGGGHVNAAGCTVAGDLPTVRATVLAQLIDATR